MCILSDRGMLRSSPTNVSNGDLTMATVIAVPLFAAAGYSLVYLLAGGGVFGEIVIFFIAKMLGR